jgi:hypothetical protein
MIGKNNCAINISFSLWIRKNPRNISPRILIHVEIIITELIIITEPVVEIFLLLPHVITVNPDHDSGYNSTLFSKEVNQMIMNQI